MGNSVRRVEKLEIKINKEFTYVINYLAKYSSDETYNNMVKAQKTFDKGIDLNKIIIHYMPQTFFDFLDIYDHHLDFQNRINSLSELISEYNTLNKQKSIRYLQETNEKLIEENEKLIEKIEKISIYMN